ncbi:MAG: bifunctional 4-hydroxy-2-oxoglutarate aldolase/2-dehydro-3-deoxy-phosphogluconate aldolase [Gammaproteobacteria bacterium]|nr:bifunctional 4-hydroxy-2-oxoglutarate aldolase/2-dehydro-3-deoxy-phosphogluconate aldolase [Gammaproteobacteria bacterium]
MHLETLLRLAPVIPVLTITRLEQAVPLARALVEGGLPVLEITLRTDVALQAMAAILEAVPTACVGAGTVTDEKSYQAVTALGVSFAVSPGLTPTLAAVAQTGPVPLLPGVMTPTEVISARAAGFNCLKLFPAAQAGGLGMLKALAGPFPDVKFCPTGGVGPDNLAEFLAQPNVICVGGSWVAPPGLLERGDWESIRALAAAAVAAGGKS